MTMPDEIRDREYQKFVEDSDGNVSVRTNLVVKDIEIGAVELKNATDDTRAVVKSDGTNNALVVVQNTVPTTTVTATDLDIRDLTSTKDSVEVKQSTASNLNATVTATHLDIRHLNTTDDSVNATCTATHLDIRHLNSTDDAVTVSANNLDIRDLTSSSDSVEVKQSTASNLNANVSQSTGSNLHTVVDSGNITATCSATDFDIRDLSSTSDSVKVEGGNTNAVKVDCNSSKVEIVDGSGNIVGSTSNAMDVNIKSGSIANTSFAATQSGTWSSRTQDGSGNSIGSTGSALDVNIKSGNPTSIAVTQSTSPWVNKLVDKDGNNFESIPDESGNKHLGVGVIQDVIADANNTSSTNITSGSFFVGSITSTLGIAGIQISLKCDQNCIIFVAQLPSNTVVTGKGTVAANNSTTLTGTGTQFTKDFVVGDTVIFDSAGTPQSRIVASVTSDTVLDVTSAFTGGSLTGKAYTHYPFDLRDQYSYTANSNFGITVQAINSYYRVRVQNIGSATTQVFRLQTCLCPIVESVPRSLDRNGNFKVANGVDYLGFTHHNTPNDETLVSPKIRLVGTIFDGSTLDSNFYTVPTPTGGSVAQTNSELILTSGTANLDFARIYTSRRARWITGTSNKYRAQLKFGDSGTANVNRRWGVGWGATMPTVTDGAYFKLYGTTFTIATMNNTSEVEVAQGSFNGDFGPSYTPTLTNNTTYEILYTLGSVYFLIGGILLHKASFNTNHWTKNTVTFHAFADVNNTGVSSAVTMTFRMMNISRLGELLTSPQYYYFADNTTTGTQLKYGAGNLHKIIITQTQNTSAITISDSTTAATPVILTWTASASSVAPIVLDCGGLPFFNGLRLTVATKSSGMTIIYE